MNDEARAGGTARLRRAVEALHDAELERDAAVVEALASGTAFADVVDCTGMDESQVRRLEQDWSAAHR